MTQQKAEAMEHGELIARLEAATDLLRRAATYIGRPSENAALRQSPTRVLASDIEGFLRTQDQGDSL